MCRHSWIGRATAFVTAASGSRLRVSDAAGRLLRYYISACEYTGSRRLSITTFWQNPLLNSAGVDLDKSALTRRRQHCSHAVNAVLTCGKLILLPSGFRRRHKMPFTKRKESENLFRPTRSMRRQRKLEVVCINQMRPEAEDNKTHLPFMLDKRRSVIFNDSHEMAYKD